MLRNQRQIAAVGALSLPLAVFTKRPTCLPNVHAQRPEGEEREPPVRWNVMLGSVKSLNDLVRS